MIPSLLDTPECTVSHKTCEEWLELAFPLQMAIQAGGEQKLKNDSDKHCTEQRTAEMTHEIAHLRQHVEF